MPDLMIDLITSQEGCAAAEGWPGLWGMGGPEYLEFLEHDGRQDRTVLMGATTYRLMSEIVQEGEAGADELTAMRKVVFSSTLAEPLSWASSSLVRGDAVEAVREMKEQGDAPLRTLGSLSLSRSLLRAGLVDRFRVVVFPVVTGSSGRERVYDGWPDVALDVVDHRVLDGRLLMTEYVPRLLDGPPS